MPTPTLTCACEYANGTINTPSSARYFRYFIFLTPFFRIGLSRTAKSLILRLQFFLLKVSTRLNSDDGGKLRKWRWLISAILREFSHLRGK